MSNAYHLRHFKTWGLACCFIFPKTHYMKLLKHLSEHQSNLISLSITRMQKNEKKKIVKIYFKNVLLGCKTKYYLIKHVAIYCLIFVSLLPNNFSVLFCQRSASIHGLLITDCVFHLNIDVKITFLGLASSNRTSQMQDF